MEISVILPVYNSENELEDCIASVLHQSFSDIELIVVDDGSTDHSQALLDKIAQKDKRVKVIHKSNGGVSSARNAGISAAAGNFIAFIDSDDRYKPDYLETLHNIAVSKEADYVCCGFENTEGKVVASVSFRHYKDSLALLSDYEELLNSRYLNIPWNKLIRTSRINARFPEGISLGEDLMFNLKVLSSCKNIIVIPDSLYIYKQNNAGLTGKYHHNGFEAACQVNEAIRKFAGAEWCRSHEDYLNYLFYVDYIRCIKKLAAVGNISESEKKQIFKSWNQSSQVKSMFQMRCSLKKRISRRNYILLCVNKWFLYSRAFCTSKKK